MVKRGPVSRAPSYWFCCINIAQTIDLKKTVFPLFVATGWFIISFILLTLPGSAIPKENWLDKIWADKWVHIVMFGLLTFLWCRVGVSLDKKKKSLHSFFAVVAILSAAYGIGMEFVQKYCVSNRSFDIGDIIADSVGALSGYLYSVKRYIKK